jgi:predicted dehydrogenase
MSNQGNSRRKFIKQLGVTTAAIAGSKLLAANLPNPERSFSTMVRQQATSPNNNLQIALIGAGGMGISDTTTALQHQGVKLVAVADLYEGRLKAAKDRWGQDIYTTRHYKDLLNRTDIDAVIVATPDFWHEKISVDALVSGKSVYCEKPMVHSITEGHNVIEAQKKSGKVFVVGSQGLSSLGNQKAKELLAEGAIGKITFAEGFWARHSPVGAWQYAIPADASPATVDWDTYLKDKKKYEFDALRFFRWRNYLDYGTGMSGDLFVHLFSSLHFITNSKGPNKVYASGGLRYWKDGREVPDVLVGVFDYPENQDHPGFNLSLRCNFVDGTSGTTYLKIVGTEGSMDVLWDEVIVRRNKESEEDDPFAKEKARENNSAYSGRKTMLPPEEVVYTAEKGYKGAHYDHFASFFNAIRTGSPVVEDAIFGFRASAPALLCNDSYFKNEAIKWNPEKMILTN